MSILETYISSYFDIHNEELKVISEMFSVTTIEKNDFFCKVDTECKQLSFIDEGYFRIFKYTDEGKEITQWIASPGEFITDLSSIVFNTPSKWNIKAITDCKLYTIKKEDYNRIGNIVKNWSILEKLFLTKCFLTLEDRMFSMLSMSAEERYNMLFQMKPELFNQVSLTYLASMLGMAPETFSRIRKKKNSLT